MIKKQKLNKSMLLFYGIFLFIGVVLFAIGVLIYISNQNFKRSAVQTKSVITDINRYRDYSTTNSGDRYNYEVYVSFTVDDVIYEGILNEWNSGMYVGQSITIYYNPNNPLDFRKDSSLILFIFIPIGLLFILIGAVSLIMMIRRNSNKNKLIESGFRVMADITDIINSNIELNNRKGKHIICERIDEVSGAIYRYKSDVIWSDPSKIIEWKNITKLPVYIDKNNKKNYYVDISQLDENIEDYT